jgi:hypothetical protein
MRKHQANILILLIALSACANLGHAPSIYDVSLDGSVEDVARAKCTVAGITPDRKGYGDCMAMYSDIERRRRFPAMTASSAAPARAPDELRAPVSQPEPPASIGITARDQAQANPFEIKLRKAGGILVVPVTINNALTLNFVVDSGAADVSIPADVVLTLIRTGTLSESDFLGTKTYQLADGSTVPSQTFRIRVLKVGDHEITNVQGSVAGISGPLLLGQSFLRRFSSWSIDNHRDVLRLD